MVNSICDWTRTQLSAYVDGELRSDVSHRISDHLEGCPDCRERLREESELVTNVIHTLVSAEPPRDLGRRIVSAARHSAPSWTATKPRCASSPASCTSEPPSAA